MKTNVIYNLSAAGQKAALIAGRTATARVTEVMEFEDAALIEKLTILPDGTLTYNPQSAAAWNDPPFTLDAPPADLTALIAAGDAYVARLATEHEEEAVQKKAKEEQEAQARKQKAEADYPVVEAILQQFEAAPLDEDLPAGLHDMGSYCNVYANGAVAILTDEQNKRFKARLEARANFRADKKAEEERLKQAEHDAMIAEHGGLLFPVEAGMCSFLGQNLWRGGQSKRWVGKFTAPKGIDKFMDSPRDEFVFSVSDLKRGDCVQGAGFDTNSRGKRRHESEWFGVVVRRDEAEIVVAIHNSRAAALKAAAKLDK